MMQDEFRGRIWFLWLGVFFVAGNWASAIFFLIHGDVFLFLVGTCVGVFVGQSVWERRDYLFDPDEYK